MRLAVREGCSQADIKRVPLSPGDDWSPDAVTISDASVRVCVLGHASGYPGDYAVLCADVPDR